jgi:chorismate synthase
MRFLTAGESHGPALTAVVEGCPAGVPLSGESIDRQLRRRQGGYGRGGRMAIEADHAEILGGVRFGRTLGSPISLLIRNLDFENWTEAMAVDGSAPNDDQAARRVRHPRPGHADLAGALKYGTHDVRDVLERASARETAARTAAGTVARVLLEEVGVRVTSHTVAVGGVRLPGDRVVTFEEAAALPEDAALRAPDEDLRAAMVAEIDACRAERDSCDAVFEVIAAGVPPGLGSPAHWDRRLDGELARGIMSIPSVKIVEIGSGLGGDAVRGAAYHDEILPGPPEVGFVRPTNRAGGIEGGMTNGQEVRVRGHMKPLSTLPRPLRSVDLVSKEAGRAVVERTDAVPIVAGGVIGEAMVAWVLASALLDKCGGDTLYDVRANLRAYRSGLEGF